jgi:hypothetical protein
LELPKKTEKKDDYGDNYGSTRFVMNFDLEMGFNERTSGK